MFVPFITVLLCNLLCFSEIDASAIPMWEFLTKEEKMSYLYSMFANQVDEFCGTKSNMANCNEELLRYGLGKLKGMPEDHLDTMDPYQRGANDLIWDSMMEGHEMMRAPKPRPSTTTPKPNSYDHDFGAASAKIDVYGPSPQKPFVYTLQTGIQQYVTAPRRGNGAYTKFQRAHAGSTTTSEPVLGPVEVRVYPDGRPVKQGVRLPQDDDLRQYQMQKTKVPNFS